MSQITVLSQSQFKHQVGATHSKARFAKRGYFIFSQVMVAENATSKRCMNNGKSEADGDESATEMFSTKPILSDRESLRVMEKHGSIWLKCAVCA